MCEAELWWCRIMHYNTPPPPRNILGILIFEFSKMHSHLHQPRIKGIEALFVTGWFIRPTYKFIQATIEIKVSVIMYYTCFVITK